MENKYLRCLVFAVSCSARIPAELRRCFTEPAAIGNESLNAIVLQSLMSLLEREAGWNDTTAPRLFAQP
jgi:hypothetical protein